MSPILEPLTPFRKHLTIVSGLRNKPAESPEPHGYIEQDWLSCVKAVGSRRRQSGRRRQRRPVGRRHVGQDTRLPSLELTTAQGGARRRMAHADTIVAAGKQPARGVPEAVRTGRYR